MMRKIIVSGLTAALLLGMLLLPVGAASSFSDVAANAWYAGDVASVQQYGIINGTGNGRFSPNGKLTLAEAITMAARTYAHISGETIPTGGDTTWYAPYLRYAAEKGICATGEFGTNYNGSCSRLTMGMLFERVIPSGTDKKINQVDSIPDVQKNSVNTPIFHLYELGITVGSDKYGTFQPNQNITRAETAAILNRVLDPLARKKVTLESVPSVEDIYAAAFDQAWDYFYCSDNVMSEYILYCDMFDGGTLGCDFYDIDGNGTPEMLVGFSNQPEYIYAIYTIHDYHAVCLGTGWLSDRYERHYTLCSDGRVADWFYGVGYSGFDLYRFPGNGTELTVTDFFVCERDWDWNIHYWYSNTEDFNSYAEMGEYIFDTDGHTGFKAISEGYFNSTYEKFIDSVKYSPTFD